MTTIIVQGSRGGQSLKDERDQYYEKHRREAEIRGAAHQFGQDFTATENDKIRQHQAEMRRVIQDQSRENERRLGLKGLKKAWELRQKGLL